MSERKLLSPFLLVCALLLSNGAWAIGQSDELAAKSQRGREAIERRQV